MEDVAFIKTPLGIAKITGSSEGLSSIIVLDSKEPLTDIIPESLEDAVYQLNEYFEGIRTEFQLDLNPEGTEFQKKVWLELQNIPYGRTASYMELSKLIGDPKAIRAVGSANGRNPLWIVVPCHRAYSKTLIFKSYKKDYLVCSISEKLLSQQVNVLSSIKVSFPSPFF